MRVISSLGVEKVSSEMGRYSESRMSEEANRFLRQQPHLVEFLREFTADFQPELQQLSLYLAYLIWKVCSRGWAHKMPSLAWELCYQCFFQEREAWRKAKASEDHKSTQPYLVQCISAFAEEDNTGMFRKEVEKGSFLLILRAVISAFEKAISRL